jgi:hypothetical protein
MPSIFEKLKFTSDLRLGDVQSADEMTVVPIIGDDITRVASPSALVFQQTRGYGTMVFQNQDKENPAIVPAHIQVRGKGAQDHAMSGAGFIKASAVKRFSDACCIESGQGGMLSNKGNELDVLPAELRKDFLNTNFRRNTEFGKLWRSIENWLRGIPGVSVHAHLRYFYDNAEYKKSLEEFSAEFEPVPGQIGAIILFNGIPVGIEIMPSAEHWVHYWKMLIRGCYGAELIRLKKLGRLKDSTLVLPNIPDWASPGEVKAIMTDFAINLREGLIPLLEQIKVKKTEPLSSEGNLKLELVHTESGGGGDPVF